MQASQKRGMRGGALLLAGLVGGIGLAAYFNLRTPQAAAVPTKTLEDKNMSFAQRIAPPHVYRPGQKKVKVEYIKLTRPDVAAIPRVIPTEPVAPAPSVFQPADVSKACNASLMHADRFAAVAVIKDANGQERTVLDVGGDLLRHPASLTKMMTLLIVFQQLEAKTLKLADTVPFSEYARSAPKVNILFERAQIKKPLSLEKVMLAVGVKSANDGARALAELVAGSEGAFVRMMNENAKMIGMSSTVFKNASGLPDLQQVTTARDMLKLESYIQSKYPKYAKYLSTTDFTLGQKKNKPLVLTTGNDLLQEEIEGGWTVHFAKTGFVIGSGYNMALEASRINPKTKKREDMRLVVLGGRSKGKRNECIETIAAKL